MKEMTKAKALQKAYSKAVKLYRAQVRRMEKRGYIVKAKLPPKPKKITEASVRRIQKEQRSLYEKSEYVTPQGEVLTGVSAQRRLRKEAAKKGEYKRQVKRAIRKNREDQDRRTRERHQRERQIEQEYEQESYDRERKRIEDEAYETYDEYESESVQLYDAERRRKLLEGETYEEKQARLQRSKERERWLKDKARAEARQKRRLTEDGVYASQFSRSEMGRQWISDAISDIEKTGYTASADMLRSIINNALAKRTEEIYDRLLDAQLSKGEALTDAEMNTLHDYAKTEAEQGLYSQFTEGDATVLMMEVTASAYAPQGARFQEACSKLYSKLTGGVPSAMEIQAFSSATEDDIGWAYDE